MESIERIWTQWNTPWAGWTLLVLLLLMLVSLVLNPSIISDSWQSVFTRMERRYEEHHSIVASILAVLFCVGTISMGVYVCLPHETFLFGTFAAIAGVVGILLAVKALIVWIVLKVMSPGLSYFPLIQHYLYLWICISMVVYPVVSLALQVDAARAIRIGLIVWTGFALLIMLFKYLRTFVNRPISFLYLVLYICTLELLPLAVMISAAQTLING